MLATTTAAPPSSASLTAPTYLSATRAEPICYARGFASSPNISCRMSARSRTLRSRRALSSRLTWAATKNPSERLRCGSMFGRRSQPWGRRRGPEDRITILARGTSKGGRSSNRSKEFHDRVELTRGAVNKVTYLRSSCCRRLRPLPKSNGLWTSGPERAISVSLLGLSRTSSPPSLLLGTDCAM